MILGGDFFVKLSWPVYGWIDLPAELRFTIAERLPHPRNLPRRPPSDPRRSIRPVSDIIQVWLNVGQHPARGKEQADIIWWKILAPTIESPER